MFRIERVVARFRASPLAHNAVWMFSGLGASFALQAITFLLLARLLGVKEYGVFAGAYALVSTVTPYSSLGSQMVFMRYVSSDRSRAQTYWGNSLCTTAVVTALLVATMALVGKSLYGIGSLGLIVVLVLSNCFMSQVVNNASIVFQTFEQLKATAWLRALSNALRLVAIAILFLCVHHATAFQGSISIFASSAAAATIALWWVRSSIGKLHLDGRLFRDRFWEGIGFSFAGSTTAVYNDIDKILLSHYGMNVANGIYSMAYRVVDFATTPVNAIDSAALPRYFALVNRGLPSIARIARKLVPVAALSGLAAAGVTLIMSPLFVRVVGRDFAESMIAFRWLCWLPALRGVHQLAGGVLTATGHQNYRTTAQFAVAALNLCLNLAWIPSHGWLGAAWASLISDGALGVINILLALLVFTRGSQSAIPVPPESA